MRQYYYEDARWPWRADSILRRFLGKRKSEPQRHREHRAGIGRALDLGMGYGRNALWLAERGYEVEGWEQDRRYVAEARREARRRGVRLYCVERDFTHLPRRGRPAWPYDVIVVSLALHQVRRSAALRVLRWSCQALAPGGQLFLMVKLTRDRLFQRARRNPAWRPVPGERNTFLRPQRRRRGYFHPGRPRRPRMILSALEPAEVRAALRGFKVRHYREVVLRSEWEEPEGACPELAERVTHHVAEVVAERAKTEKPFGYAQGKRKPKTG